MQPAGEGQRRAVLYVEGEVVDVQGTGGHHLEGLVVLDLAVMPDIDIRDVWRLPHVHTGQGRGGFGAQEAGEAGCQKVSEQFGRGRDAERVQTTGQLAVLSGLGVSSFLS